MSNLSESSLATDEITASPLVDSVRSTALSRVQRMRRLATIMDSAYRIPGTRWTIGLDSLLGLVPGIGDVATTAVAGFIVREAIQLGVRKRTITRMIGNIAVDLAVGTIPLLGDVFDFAFKSNLKNVALLERDLHRRFNKVEAYDSEEGWNRRPARVDSTPEKVFDARHA